MNVANVEKYYFNHDFNNSNFGVYLHFQKNNYY
jgi:hypothetical protein